MKANITTSKTDPFTVDGSGTGYLKTVCDYVHLNPARAKLLPPEQRLSRYRRSSYPAHLLPPGRRPAWLRVDRLLGEHGLRADTKPAHREFAVRMEARRTWATIIRRLIIAWRRCNWPAEFGSFRVPV